MLFLVLARKSYRRNLQYRSSHMIHNIASCLFGFIYIYIWIGIADDNALGEYGLAGMISYVAFNQCSLWVTSFLTPGLGIGQSVRSGQIATDLMRPSHLFYQSMCKEWGQVAYQFAYKFVPIYFLYFIVFPLHVPDAWFTYAWTAAALLLGAYISICVNYLIGAAALWTTESQWLYWVNFALSQLLSGFLIPIDWLPGWLQSASAASFYPFLHYIPAKIYLGLEPAKALIGACGWAAGLTLLSVAATGLMRRKVEVQGG